MKLTSAPTRTGRNLRIAIALVFVFALWTHRQEPANWVWGLSYAGVLFWSSSWARSRRSLQGPALWSAWCLASGIRLLPNSVAGATDGTAALLPHGYALTFAGGWLAWQVYRRYRAERQLPIPEG